MKKRIIIFILVVIVIAEVWISFGDKINIKSQKSYGTPIERLAGVEVGSERARWSKMMDEDGVDVAYEEFKKQYAGAMFGVQHTMAHVIGELIYQKKGMDGMVICDSTFTFGCYHSFYSQALADKGPSIVPLADKLCVAKFGPLGTGCQHGIGHGLMDFYGPEKLLLALEACSGTTQLKKLFGCTSGVFMEYNVPIVMSIEDPRTIPRSLNKDEPYAPCPSVPEKYRDSCYYEMPQWWDKQTVFDKDYKKIGELCQSISSPTNRESCFLGIGNVVAPSNNYVVADTVNKCEAMPTKESKIICKSGASWSFYSSVTYRNLALEVCDDLDEESQKKCVSKSDLIGQTH